MTSSVCFPALRLIDGARTSSFLIWNQQVPCARRRRQLDLVTVGISSSRTGVFDVEPSPTGSVVLRQ